LEAIIRALLGSVVLVAIAYAFSANRKHVSWRLVGIGLGLQLVLGLILLKIPQAVEVFNSVSAGFVELVNSASAGARFVFGELAINSFADPQAKHSMGFLFAFQVLPVIIFFSTLVALLYYFGILQKVVYAFAWVMNKTMRLSGAESLSAAANVFLGQTEAPILVKPYIGRMTRSELMCLMTGGMATIAGSVMVSYIQMLGGASLEEQTAVATQLISASIMNAPAGIVMAKILMPETEPDAIDRNLRMSKENIGSNAIDAMANGARDGLGLALNVAAMLIGFIAVVALVNHLLAITIGEWTGLNQVIAEQSGGVFNSLSMEYLLGQVCRVVAFVIGVDWADSLQVGSLLGQKTVLNEFVAYINLSNMKADGLLSERSIKIATFALCGFSNFSSIAVQIGGIGSMAPNQQGNLSKLGMRALLGASLACLLTATLAGALI